MVKDLPHIPKPTEVWRGSSLLNVWKQLFLKYSVPVGLEMPLSRGSLHPGGTDAASSVISDLKSSVCWVNS